MPFAPPPPQATADAARQAAASSATARFVAAVDLTGPSSRCGHASAGTVGPMTDRASTPPAGGPATLPQAWAARFAEAPDRPMVWEARRGWVPAGALDRASRRV